MDCCKTFLLVMFVVLTVPWTVGAQVEVSDRGDSALVSLADDENGSGPVAAGWFEEEEYVPVLVADPLEFVNRTFFYFNDKLYFWVLRPLARSYSFVAPKPVRKCVGNFFYNLKMPIRFTNNFLQGKFVAGGHELTRFMVNSTVGVAGLWDPARNWLDLASSEEDFGQTLGKYGVGEGFFICWPILGPSNVRDSLGSLGDHFLNPVSYLGFNGEEPEAFAVKSGEVVNKTSLHLGDYEDFKKATFDPYSAARDAYSQSRRSKIKDENN